MPAAREDEQRFWGGYPEDEETLERIDRDEPAGDGPLGPYLDRWFLSRPVCRARRAGRARMTALIQQVATAVSEIQGRRRKKNIVQRAASDLTGAARKAAATTRRRRAKAAH